MILETDRTILRNFENKDLKEFNEYCSQDGLGEMAGWKHHCDLSMSKEILNKNINNENIFAIENKENIKVIGHISIQNDSENGRADTKELGFILNSNYHNQGIMTEVVYKVLDYLFCNEIEYVYACCSQKNRISKHLIEKCGFTFEQEGTFYAESLNETFLSFEYVWNKNDWQLQKLK
ncbi:GNAT family N-acetyltransferase [Clostridium gasigenes]|uniref:GNAT family N-acetyltransferase n=1 Tax=Clostridium gasigenes TaxID=94869 RepID=A0A7X0VRR7_9CLOT|nr:GNAT family protein [Clostridium gasigenes]MBB6715263.1 GNAT family N-acetyltransferase [Clostridium gasigenes]